MVSLVARAYQNELAAALAASALSQSELSDTDEQVIQVKKRRLNNGEAQATAVEVPLTERVHRKTQIKREQLSAAIAAADPDQVMPHVLWGVVVEYAKDTLCQRLLEAAENDHKAGKLHEKSISWNTRQASVTPTEIECLRGIIALDEFQENPAQYMATWPKTGQVRDLDRPSQAQYEAWKAAGAPKGMRWGDTFGNLFYAFKNIEDFVAGESKRDQSDPSDVRDLSVSAPLAPEVPLVS